MSIIRYQTPELASWPSFDRWATLRDEINNMFDLPAWSNSGRQTPLFGGWMPALDLYQSADNVVAVVELPGLQKEDIELSLQNGMLTISGERKTESSDGDKTERTERFHGKFRRSVTLPAKVDVSNVHATYKDGILTVTLPKAEEAKPKQIQVNVD